MSVVGAILAGGRSSRMGVDKAEVEVAGQSMIDRVHKALGEVVDSVVLLGSEREGFVSWPDEFPAAGPLSGIATALSRAESARVVVVAVDHPFVRPETLQGLLQVESAQAVIPVDRHGVRQVTCALYPASLSMAAGEEANAGGSVQSLLDRVAFEPVTPDVWESWGEDGRSWFSIDTPEALAEATRLYL